MTAPTKQTAGRIRRWTVKRIVHEYYEVYAQTRQEALDNSVFIKGETATLRTPELLKHKSKV